MTDDEVVKSLYIVYQTGATVNYNRGLSSSSTWVWIQPESVCEDTLQRCELFVSAYLCCALFFGHSVLL